MEVKCIGQGLLLTKNLRLISSIGLFENGDGIREKAEVYDLGYDKRR
jgi:hypothetical protein